MRERRNLRHYPRYHKRSSWLSTPTGSGSRRVQVPVCDLLSAASLRPSSIIVKEHPISPFVALKIHPPHG
jgi:hypothetical protein